MDVVPEPSPSVYSVASLLGDSQKSMGSPEKPEQSDSPPDINWQKMTATLALQQKLLLMQQGESPGGRFTGARLRTQFWLGFILSVFYIYIFTN